MNIFLLKAIAITLLSAISINTHSHHSFVATFDPERLTTVQGEITDFKFRNPHVLIHLDVANDDGTVTNWMAESTAAIAWRRSGWEKDSLKVGEMLRITGNATHDGSPMVSIGEFSLLDPTGTHVIVELSKDENPEISKGNTIEVADAKNESEEVFLIPLKLPSGEPNFTGITMQKGGLVPGVGIGLGPDAYDSPPPYNETGQAALAAVDLTSDPQVFCDPPGIMRQAGYTPYGFKLAQYSDHITIEYEEYGTKRAIFFDDKLPKPGPRSEMGDSVARYEGDALIIETVNIAANFSGHRGRPLSDEARLTEVYTRIDNPALGSIVQTETTVTDPKFLTKPWSIKRYKLYSNDYEFIENECTPPLRKRPASIYQYTEFDSQFLN